MKKIKKLVMPFVCKVILKPKSFFTIPDHIQRIPCKNDEIELLSQTSNNVHIIHTGDKDFYFRECKKHLPQRDYVMDSIRLYFTYVVEDIHGDWEFLQNGLIDDKQLQIFTNMGMTNDQNSGAYRFCMGQGPQWIGLPTMDRDREERLKDLVQYIWGDLFSYGLNNGLKIGHYQTYNAVRSIATYRMAELIGLGAMVPKTNYALLCPEGREPIFGTIMDAADGVCMERMSCDDRQRIASPDLQKALNNLNLLDVLNTEKDHRTGNYNIVINNEKATNVIAFDNDSPNAFGVGGISFKTYMGCSPWCQKGKLNRPFMDRHLADRVLDLRWSIVKKSMKGILNPFQMLSLKRRLKLVKRVLRRTPASAFVTDNCWTTETMKCELSGTYGKTYLAQFLEEQKLLHQPWVKDRVYAE